MKLIDKNMKIKTVRISDKGQIAIPIDIRNSLGLKRGDELVLIQTDNKILIEKPRRVIKEVKENFKDMITLTESSLKKLWLNKEDEIWNEYLKKVKK
jgi:AbrB family looped-hinge helix DNA binding protein